MAIRKLTTGITLYYVLLIAEVFKLQLITTQGFSHDEDRVTINERYTLQSSVVLSCWQNQQRFDIQPYHRPSFPFTNNLSVPTRRIRRKTLRLESESLSSAGNNGRLDSRGCNERVGVRCSGEGSDRCSIGNTAKVVTTRDSISNVSGVQGLLNTHKDVVLNKQLSTFTMMSIQVQGSRSNCKLTVTSVDTVAIL